MPISNLSAATSKYIYPAVSSVGKKLLGYFNTVFDPLDEAAGKADEWLEGYIPGLGRELEDFNKATPWLNPAGWEGNALEAAGKMAPMAAALFTNPKAVERMTSKLYEAIYNSRAGTQAWKRFNLLRAAMKERYPRVSRVVDYSYDNSSASSGKGQMIPLSSKLQRYFRDSSMPLNPDNLGLVPLKNPGLHDTQALVPNAKLSGRYRSNLRKTKQLAARISLEGLPAYADEFSPEVASLKGAVAPGIMEHEMGHLSNYLKGKWAEAPPYKTQLDFYKEFMKSPEFRNLPVADRRAKALKAYITQPEEIAADKAGQTIQQSLSNYAQHLGFNSWEEFIKQVEKLSYDELDRPTSLYAPGAVK